nr:uncharacterized protein LOC113705760 [Coffea arabica]
MERKEVISGLPEGLDKGSPSPCLFLLVSEALSNIFKNAMHDHIIFGLKIAPSSPNIAHLFLQMIPSFSVKLQRKKVSAIMQILMSYGEASGQVINIDKCSIFHSKNTSEGCRNEILSTLGAMNQVKQSKYLSLPMVIGRTNRQVFNYIREKVSNKLRGWKEKLLSNAGKEVLLKSVVLAMPTYAMAYCKLPKTLCKNICKEMANFW